MNDKPEDQSEDTPRPTLGEAIKGLDPTDDDHWTMMGKPSINHLSEVTGTKVTKTIVDEAGFGDVNRDQCLHELRAAEAKAKAEEGPDMACPPKYSDEQIIEAAKAAHIANKAYCESIGDDSQPTWDEAPDWQKDSAIAGVKFHLRNPDADSAASHNSWLAQKKADGWVYGDVKDEKAKTHPCIVPFEDLPLNQQVKDGIFRATVWGSLNGNPAEDTAEDQTHVDEDVEAATDGGPPPEGSPPEKGGGEPDERGPDDPPPADEDAAKEPTLADDKRAGAVDPETGEPRIALEKFAAVLRAPHDYSPEDVGAAIIKGLDHLALALTTEVRTRQPELFQVFQLFAAERPSILERQKRLQLRQNQG